MIGLTSHELLPADSGQLLSFGIGPTNLAKRQAGSDDQPRFGKADAIALRAKVVLYQPRYLCFNGERAAREFFRSPEVAYGVRVRGRKGRSSELQSRYRR